ncbi:hypothetical protein ACFXPT_15650 [Streptomyces goshikiensis]|uniref:hypothetical protein n=1 Tax=Streptomyces goshikiensis TaxID=1942 RepID=UPI00368E2362
MLNMSKIPGSAVEPVTSALLSIGFTDFALRELGATKGRPPSSYGGEWVDHLSWGVDSAYSAARFLFSGQFLGATAILRSQFERWTENAAYNTNTTHKKGESVANFAARAWAKCHKDFPFARREIRENPNASESESDSAADSTQDSAHELSVTIGKDHKVHPAELMDSMSNLLHSRGPWVDVLHWDSGQLLGGTPPPSLGEVANKLSDAIALNLRHIRLCLAALAEEQGKMDLPHKILSSSFEMARGGHNPPALPSLIPMLPNAGLMPEVVAGLEDAARAHDGVMSGKRPAGRLYRDDEFSLLHFYERRARAANWALTAFEIEKERTGSLDFDYLKNRDFRYLVAAEMAGLVSVWLGRGPAADAAAACSSAMRSAYWLWLEDDDRALATLRVLLEQCGRLRVWTEKPEKAEKLEASTSRTPKDWLVAAGWRRLSALNKALGEFSRAHANIRWDGAREILQKIQHGDMDPEDSVHMARGHSLDALTFLLLTESIGSASKLSPAIGAAFREIVNDLLIEENKLLADREALFNRTLLQKDASLGDYSFRGPADATRRPR